MKWLIYLFLLSSYITNCFGNYSIDILQENDTLESVAKRNQSRIPYMYRGNLQEYMKDLTKWNPQVKDWNHPVKNQMIYIEYPYAAFVSGSSYAPPLGIYSNRRNSDLIFKFGYLASFGKYSEDGSSLIENDFKNPGDFNISPHYFINDNIIITKFHWSLPNNATITNSDTSTEEKLKLPSEWGYSIGYSRMFKKLGFTSSYDFEQINSFNIEDISNGKAVQPIKNSIHFISIGFIQNFYFLTNSKLNLSVGKAIKSSEKDNISLKGYKYDLAYTFEPDNALFNYNISYKHYELKGQSKIKIDTIGLGIIFNIF